MDQDERTNAGSVWTKSSTDPTSNHRVMIRIIYQPRRILSIFGDYKYAVHLFAIKHEASDIHTLSQSQLMHHPTSIAVNAFLTIMLSLSFSFHIWHRSAYLRKPREMRRVMKYPQTGPPAPKTFVQNFLYIRESST